MMVETARQHEISSVEFSSSRLVKVNFRNPLGSAANVPSISVSGRRKFLSRLTANLLLRKGYRCATRLLSAPRTRFLRFQPREETLNTLIYRRSYDATFIGQLFFFTRFLDFEIRWNDESNVPTFFNDVSLCSYSPQMSPFVVFALIQWLCKVFAHRCIYRNIHKY